MMSKTSLSFLLTGSRTVEMNFEASLGELRLICFFNIILAVGHISRAYFFCYSARA